MIKVLLEGSVDDYILVDIFFALKFDNPPVCVGRGSGDVLSSDVYGNGLNTLIFSL